MNHKILYIDIETSPSTGYFFDYYKEGNILKTTQSWFILSFAYKWEHERTYHVRALCDYKGYKKNRKDDKALVTDLWKLLNEADVVVGHNHDRFDLRKIRSRLLKHRLAPLSPFKTVDTLKVMRRYFAEDSNRLDAVSQNHGLGRKLPHQGFRLWEECMEGNRKAWATMKRYNIQDVRLTVALYKLIRPWYGAHPNLSAGTTSCPVCGANNSVKDGVSLLASGAKKQTWQCKACGHYYKTKYEG